MEASTAIPDRVWAKHELARIPYWIYTDQALFVEEMKRIFCGKSWSYVGLAVEVPNPGSFKTSAIGDRSIVVCRNRAGELRALRVLVESREQQRQHHLLR